jgi:hypothetical protein
MLPLSDNGLGMIDPKAHSKALLAKLLCEGYPLGANLGHSYDILHFAH